MLPAASRAVSIAFLLSLGICRPVFPQGEWKAVRPYPTSGNLTDMAWSGTRLVAVGPKGVRLTSTDGIRWENQASENRSWFTGIAWSGNRFLLWDINGKFWTSSDGLAWAASGSGPAWYPKAVAWTGKAYLGVGYMRTSSAGSTRNEGVIMGSPDGLLWTRQSPVLPDSLRRPTYDGILAFEGSVLVLADSGFGFTLRDGWEFGEAIRGMPRHRGVEKLIHGGGRYLALTSGYGWMTSPDGLQWSRLEVPSSTAMVWGQDHFVAVGHQSYTALDTTFSAVSGDGSSWTKHRTRILEGAQDIAWTGSLFVAVGWHGRIATSPDGKTWTLRSSLGPLPDLNQVVYHGGRFIAVGNGGAILSSDRGVEWIEEVSGTPQDLHCLASQGGRLVAGGDSGTLLTSEDGKAWTRRETGLKTAITGLAWCGSRWIASAATHALVSEDGTRWTPHPLDLGFAGLEGQVIWTGKHAIALGLLGGTYATMDGIRWQPVAYEEKGGSTRGYYLTCLAWTGTRLTALGDSNRVYTSADGLQWRAEARDTAGTPWLHPLRVGSLWVSAAGADTEKPFRTPRVAALRTSFDGVHWTHQVRWDAEPLKSVASDGSLLVAVGSAGTVLTAVVDPNLGPGRAERRVRGPEIRRERKGIRVARPGAAGTGVVEETLHSLTGRTLEAGPAQRAYP